MKHDDSTSRPVTQRDLATKLGVSHATISLALLDHPRISKEMRDRVKAAAIELGYKRDPMLSALATYRMAQQRRVISGEIAWINAWEHPEKLREFKEFDLYWKGAFEAAEKLGYRLEEFRLEPTMPFRRLHQILQARGIEGFLLPPHRNNLRWEDFPWDHYSVIRFGRSIPQPQFHVVTADQTSNTILAVQRMNELGYRRIGFTENEGDLSRLGKTFRLGYLGGHFLVKTRDPIEPLMLPDSPISKRLKMIDSWITRNKPDAIFTSDGHLREDLERLGIDIPGDVGLAVSSVLDAGASAGIDQHAEEIGRVGFRALSSLINDRAMGIPKIFRQILVEGSWVDGASLPSRS